VAPYSSLGAGWVMLVALVLATLVVTIDNTILNVALPSISADLGAGTSQLQWTVNAYSLLFGGLLLTGGSLADRLGRRRVLVWGLAGFAAASALVLAVSSATELIALRALSGAAAAFLMPSTVALMYRGFEGRARTTAIGIAGAVAGLGFVVGPLVGGALLEVFPGRRCSSSTCRSRSSRWRWLARRFSPMPSAPASEATRSAPRSRSSRCSAWSLR
jgi:MFS family permease